MPTIKRHKIWYILEGIRMWCGYKGDGENDHVYLPTPEWKDINGNTYTHIYAGRYADPENLVRVAEYWQYIKNNRNPSYLKYPYAWRGLLSNYSSFDSFVKVYATADILSNWSENDYNVNSIGTVELDTNFTVLSDENSPQPTINHYNNADHIDGRTDNDLINYGQRSYQVTIKNNTQSNITVSCLKFTKNIANVDLTSPYADSFTLSDQYDDIITQNNTIFEVETLYVSYYLDEPIIIEPGYERLVVVNFTPDLSKKDNFRKTRYWNAVESCRLAIVPETEGIVTKYYDYYPDRSLVTSQICKLSTQGVFIPNFSHLFTYVSMDLLGLWVPFKTVGGYVQPCVFGGTYPNKSVMEAYIRTSDTYETTSTVRWEHLNFNDFLSNFEDENGELHVADQLSLITMGSFTKDITIYATNDVETDWDIYDFDIGNRFRTIFGTSFEFSNNQYFRKYKIKAFNDSSSTITWSCIKFTKIVPCRFYAMSYYDSGSSEVPRLMATLLNDPEPKETLYGSYFFSTPIPIPPGEFRTVTLTVTPEDISIDVIIDDDEEEEEGEG